MELPIKAVTQIIAFFDPNYSTEIKVKLIISTIEQLCRDKKIPFSASLDNKLIGHIMNLNKYPDAA